MSNRTKIHLVSVIILTVSLVGSALGVHGNKVNLSTPSKAPAPAPNLPSPGSLPFEICIQDDGTPSHIVTFTLDGNYMAYDCQGSSTRGSGSVIISNNTVTLTTSTGVHAFYDNNAFTGTATAFFGNGGPSNLVDSNTLKSACNCF
jgi:hypothetical protein